jgi:hypothetical protein
VVGAPSPAALLSVAVPVMTDGWPSSPEAACTWMRCGSSVSGLGISAVVHRGGHAVGIDPLGHAHAALERALGAAQSTAPSSSVKPSAGGTKRGAW